MMKWDKLEKMHEMWNEFKGMSDCIGEDCIGLFRRLLQFSQSATRVARQEQFKNKDILWPAYYNYYLQRKFPSEKGVRSKAFDRIESIFKVLEDQQSSPMSEFYTRQAIEFYLLDQRQEEEKNELSKS